MQIGPAHGAGAHPDQHLPRAWTRHRELDRFEGLSLQSEQHRTHEILQWLWTISEIAAIPALIDVNAAAPTGKHRTPLASRLDRIDDRPDMPLLTLPALRACLTKDQRLIGIDPGSKTIGLALSDVRLTLASPFGSLKRGKLKANAAEILALARKENAGGLVVGLPLSMDGTSGPAAQGASDWALALSEATGLPAALFDERLSSAAANRLLLSAADVSRRKRAASVDRFAASWMLQAALDASRLE